MLCRYDAVLLSEDRRSTSKMICKKSKMQTMVSSQLEIRVRLHPNVASLHVVARLSLLHGRVPVANVSLPKKSAQQAMSVAVHLQHVSKPSKR